MSDLTTNKMPIITEGGPAPADVSTWGLAKRIFKDYMKPHWLRLVIAIIAMVVVAAMEGATAWILDPAIDFLFVNKNEDMLLLIPIGVVIIMTLKAFATYWQGVLMGHVAFRIIADIQIKLFSRLMDADLGWLTRHHTGTLISSFLNDALLLRQGLARSVSGLALDLAKVIALVGVMFYQDWQLALIAIGIGPIVGTYIRKVGKRMRKASTKGQEETGTLSTLLSETLSGTRTVKAYGQEAREVDRVSNSVNRRFQYLMKATRIQMASSPVTEALTGISIAAVIYYAGTKALAGTMEINHLLSFIAAMMFCFRPLKSLASLNAVIQESLSAAARIFALLDVPHEVVDRPDAKPLADPVKGQIKFDKVRFVYGDGTEALSNLSIDVPAGKTVALVGPSGGGKSTLLNLIPRFYDIAEGAITIDGTDIRDVTMASLRHHLALVTQEPFLFDDTIAANIAYGTPDATQGQIEAAADAAAALDFIKDLPEGFNTVVGESGVKLSGGQRQRIAIARAMLKNAPVLLLDEATSALDTESERKVQAALNNLMAGRTTLVIAHRLSTIIDADIIYVIADGHVAEQGNHTELLAKEGIYANLHRQSTQQ